MLKPDVVARAQQLLAEGRLSQRAIAKLVGISRWSIARLAHGRRPDYEAIRRASLAAEAATAGPLIRCPNCGRLVQAPCLACQIKAHRAQATADGDAGPIRIELVGRQRERYEEISGQAQSEERVFALP